MYSQELITEKELRCDQGVTVLEYYRAKLYRKADIPYISEMSALSEAVIVIDKFTTEDGAMMTTRSEKSPYHSSTLETDESACGGSPLKFEFLTLEKLQENGHKRLQESFAELSLVESTHQFNPMAAAVARTVLAKLTTQKLPFEVRFSETPIFVVCDGEDFLNSVLMGAYRCKNSLRTYLVRAFPRGVPDISDRLDAFTHIVDGYETRCTRVSTMHCIYDVIPRTRNSEYDDGDRISGSMEVTASWSSAKENSARDYYLMKPPPSAEISVHVVPGWLDVRVPLYDLMSELRLIFALGRALRSGHMKWKVFNSASSAASIISDIEKVMKDDCWKTQTETSNPFRDFTERLWLVMRRCNSNELLTEALRFVFNALKAGYKNTMLHPDNKSLMARLLRDACSNELMLPRLEGLTPVQILLEMGLEYVRRSCISEFLASGCFESTAEINSLCGTDTGKEPQERADALFALCNSLVVVKICKQYLRLDRHLINSIARRCLSVFNQLALSPTSGGVTNEMIQKLNYSVTSKLIFTDLSPVVHKVKKPKIWKMETTFTNFSNKKVVAQMLVHFSTKPMLPFIKSVAVVKEKPIPKETCAVADDANAKADSGDSQKLKELGDYLVETKKFGEEPDLSEYYCATAVVSYR